MRWLERRVKLVRGAALRAVILSLPDELAGCRPELSACRKRLGTKAVLVRLRTLASSSLPPLPGPLGLRPRLAGAGNPISPGNSRWGMAAARGPRSLCSSPGRRTEPRGVTDMNHRAPPAAAAPDRGFDEPDPEPASGSFYAER